MAKKIRLVVKKSQLPGAGKGLYTKDFIKKGTRIVEYKGEIITDKESERRAEEDDIYGYMFYINKKHCIDAYYTPQYVARYANDAHGIIRVKGLKNNSDYEVVGKKCFITATRDIEAGEEIFVDYGKEYWQVIRENIRLDKKNKKIAEKEKANKKMKKSKGVSTSLSAKRNKQSKNGHSRKHLNGRKLNGIKVERAKHKISELV